MPMEIDEFEKKEILCSKISNRTIFLFLIFFIFCYIPILFLKWEISFYFILAQIISVIIFILIKTILLYYEDKMNAEFSETQVKFEVIFDKKTSGKIEYFDLILTHNNEDGELEINHANIMKK